MWIRCFVTASTLVLSSCANNSLIVPAFDNLTNETSSQHSLLTNYRSFVSVSGLAPVHSAGSPFHHPYGTTPGHVIAISPKWSFVTVSNYDSKADVDVVAALRDQYL